MRRAPDPPRDPIPAAKHSTATVLGVATALTLVALLENTTVIPWAPFYVVYAGLAIGLPLCFRSFRFGSLRGIRWGTWVLALLAPIVLQAFAALWVGAIWPGLLRAGGAAGSPLDGSFYSFPAAFGALLEKIGERFGIPEAITSGAASPYLVFIVAWAGLGEELLYRGYVHGTLRERRGVAFAVLVSALFFSVRHATQLVLVGPPYPWPAAVSWVVFAFVASLAFSALYERSRSLWPPVLAHYLLNLIPMLGLLAGGDGGS